MMRAGDYEQIINYDWPYYEACFTSIIWNRLILQLAAQSLTRVFCSWPSCRGSVDWLVMQGVLLGWWCHLLLFSWCLHSGCLLWWFFFFLWRSCWSCLQNSTSFLFLQDSWLAVSGPSSFHLLFVIVIDSDFVPVILYSLLLDILCGLWIPITFLSCLLWKLFNFLISSFATPQVLQLCNSALFTSVSCSLILVASFVFQFFFQIVSFFARAIVANSFLLWMSSQSPSFDPSCITFLYSDPLLTVEYSVFSLFTQYFLCSLSIFFVHSFFCFFIDLVICLFYFCDKDTVISMHYFLWDAAFHLLNPLGICLSDLLSLNASHS